MRNGDVIEVWTYDKLPGGKKIENDDELLNMFGEKLQIDFPTFVYDDFLEHPYGKWLKWIDKNELPEGWKTIDQSRKEEYVKSSNHRSREKIRRLALKNFSNGDVFMTITFAENIQDVDYAHNELKKFMKRFRYRYGEQIPYLAVMEYQKRGAIHYHCLMGCDLGNLAESDKREAKEDEVSAIWGHGFVDLLEINSVDNVGAYLVKYLLKDLGKERVSGKKHYLCSKGLDKPEYVKDTTVVLDSLEGHFPGFTSRYENEFCGEIQYMEFNLRRGYQCIE